MTLNTPGYQDGGFCLKVNGKVVLDLADVFYRNVQGQSPDDGGGLLGPILGDLLGEVVLEDDGSQARTVAARKGPSGAGMRKLEADSKKSVERRAERCAEIAHEDGEPIGFKGIFFRYVLFVLTTQSGLAKYHTFGYSAPPLEVTTRIGPRQRISLSGTRILSSISMI